MRKRIHVAVVSHGNATEVAALLGDLERSAPLVDLSVLLVLNREEALPFCETDFTFLLQVHRNERPQGFAANNNLAFRLCRPADDDLFCIINPDVRLAEEVFGPLLGCLEREPRAALIAPLARNSQGETEDNARALPRPATIVCKALGQPDKLNPTDGHVRPVDWVAGLFMLFSARAFAAVGGFDERYFLYYEDVDICCRLRLAGWRVLWSPAVSVQHDARRTSHRRLSYLLHHIRSMMRFFLSTTYRRSLRLRAGGTDGHNGL